MDLFPGPFLLPFAAAFLGSLLGPDRQISARFSLFGGATCALTRLGGAVARVVDLMPATFIHEMP